MSTDKLRAAHAHSSHVEAEAAALPRAPIESGEKLNPYPALPRMPEPGPKWVESARQCIARTRLIKTGDPVHLLEMALKDYERLRAACAGESKITQGVLESLINEGEREFHKQWNGYPTVPGWQIRNAFIARYIYDSLHPEARVIGVPEGKG